MPKFIVMKTNELLPGDNDLDTPRRLVGSRTILQVIKHPNDPDWIASGGERFSRLAWCEECQGYRPGEENGRYHNFGCSNNHTKNPEFADDYYD